MTTRLLRRRDVTALFGLGALAACTTPPEPEPGTTHTADPESVSPEGREDVTMVDEIISEAPYDGLTVTRVKDAQLASWDLTLSRRGAPMLRYRIQGEWDGRSPQVDGYQRLEEVRALDGAGALAGDVIIPRSNWEFAFQLVVDGEAEFVPYHGAATAFGVGTAIVRIDGEEIDAESMELGSHREARSFSLTQTIRARHPRRPDTDLVEMTTTTSMFAEGRGTIEGTWSALVDVEMGNSYGPMLPFSRDVFDKVITDSGEDVPVESSDGAQTVAIDNSTAARISSTEYGWTGAISWTDPSETLRTQDGASGGTDVFLQLRDDGIAKIYPQVWEPGDTVTEGTVWEFTAEWMIAAP